MDSRIREIEQWIAEAKQDLGECGREAYINKLYLLDAEIRAIIREDGSLPAANSPRQQVNNVRRLSLPTAAIATAVGVLLLAASTVYFIAVPVAAPILASNQSAAGASGLKPSLESQPEIIPAAYIPRQIAGEEVLPFNWEPTAEYTVAASAPRPAAAGQAELIAANLPTEDSPAAAPAESSGRHTGVVPAARPAIGPAYEATEIALAATSQPEQPVVQGPREVPAANPHTTAMGGEIERTIATEVPTEDPEAPQTTDDRGFYEQWDWDVDNGDNSIEELVDEYENNELQLNSAELAEKLREVLDKSKD